MTRKDPQHDPPRMYEKLQKPHNKLLYTLYMYVC